MFIGALGFNKNWTQFILFKFEVNEFIENHVLIDLRISFKAMASSLKLVYYYN
jgi:hypothetical protein